MLKIHPPAVNRLQVLTSPRFAAGRVQFFADFDGTYCPIRHDTLKRINHNGDAPKTTQYFKQFDDFLQKTREAFQFKITTGRNLAEFETISRLLHQKGFEMPLPESIIIRNGADEIYRQGSHCVLKPNESFDFPYHLPVTERGTNIDKYVNVQKREQIKQRCGWDGPQIRAKILELLKKYDFEIRQDPTTNSSYDYGENSTLHYVHDRYREDGLVSPWVAALRQDGDLNFFIGLPADMFVKEDRNKCLREIKSELRQFIGLGSEPTQNKTPSEFIFFREKDGEYGNRASLSIIPPSGGGLGYYEFHGGLTKRYDVEQAIRLAESENDLVIAAGDGSNDKPMLDPRNLLPKELREKLQTDDEIKVEIEKLPFMGIVVKKRGERSDDLEDLVNKYGQGPNRKIICVEAGQLLEGIKTAIAVYAEQTPKFKEKLHPKIVGNFEAASNSTDSNASDCANDIEGPLVTVTSSTSVQSDNHETLTYVETPKPKIEKQKRVSDEGFFAFFLGSSRQ